MRDRAYARALRPRAPEVAAGFVGFKASHAAMVIRGTKPHDQPNFMGRGVTVRHPGARGNPVVRRAMDGATRKRFLMAVHRGLTR
jgi:hypothetical protein